MSANIPISVSHLFHPLDAKLIALLKSLTPEEWQAQSVAKRWLVKDVAAHLLDGNIRTLSIQRDLYFGEQPTGITSYPNLVNWLNELNADWVKAFRRASPEVIILLHESTGKQVSDYYTSVDLQAPAIFPVAWAGEEISKNWFHIAREYTEKWLHQQQIRDAVNKPGILTKEFYSPFLATCLMALPHTFKDIDAAEKNCLQISVVYEITEHWYLLRNNHTWQISQQASDKIHAHLTIDGNAAWKLFSKSWRKAEALQYTKIQGDVALAEQALEMISFMA